ncbi:hypothetical protein ABT288_31055 [Streptomyces sp. NPDC001093]|uniref:hypothetical protein n=1 Tax=Streptomyces sp. NPDC001093 TaxID=3154376 RepID=UPI0033339C33
MKSKNKKALGVAAMAMIMVVVGSGSAFAGSVTWLNAAYNYGGTSYLRENVYGSNSIDIGDSSKYTGWIDTKYSDGAWTEKNDLFGDCLDSNYSGQVYAHSCLSGDIYQRWYEISTNSGWCLMDEQTGLVLDAKPAVYTNTNYGDRDLNQRWD